MERRRSCPPIHGDSVAFAGYRFLPEVIVLAGRWYLHFGLSYRNLEELLAERGIEVDHCHAVSVGATLHAVAGRSSSAPSWCWWPMVRRRDLREGRGRGVAGANSRSRDATPIPSVTMADQHTPPRERPEPVPTSQVAKTNLAVESPFPSV